MNVLVVAAAFSSGMSGIQRHAFNLVRCLLLQPEISHVQLVLAPWQRELAHTAGLPSDPRLSIHIEEMGRSSAGRNLWYYRFLPALTHALETDLVHLTYPVPINVRAYACPVVVTLHDLYPYEIPLNFGFPKFLFNRIVLRQCLRNATAIACVSDVTLRRLDEYFPWAGRKAARIYNCSEPPLLCAFPSPFAEWRGEPFLLCVAQHRRNKKIPLALDVFRRLLNNGEIDGKMKLLVVGIPGPETQRIERQIVRMGLVDRVHLLDGLSDAELQTCYARCEALIAPSSTEGFGLPIVEALLAGCRVVCSDIPAFREVGAAHCRFVPLGSHAVEMFTRGIEATLSEPHVDPITLPQLSASVLGVQYATLYRRVLTACATEGSEHLSTLGPVQKRLTP